MKKNGMRLTKAIISIAAICFLFSGAVHGQPLTVAQAQNETGMEGALAAYSMSLEGNVQANSSEVSPMMNNLIKDRQEFYIYYFANALHSDLLKKIAQVFFCKIGQVIPM